MKSTKFEIRLESMPDLMGVSNCKVHVNLQGKPQVMSQMLASAMQTHPHLLAIVVEALINIDNVETVFSNPSN